MASKRPFTTEYLGRRTDKYLATVGHATTIERAVRAAVLKMLKRADINYAEVFFGGKQSVAVLRKDKRGALKVYFEITVDMHSMPVFR